MNIPKTTLDALLDAGKRCSAVCYNIRQRNSTVADDKQLMYEAYRAWDAALEQFRKSTKRKKFA